MVIKSIITLLLVIFTSLSQAESVTVYSPDVAAQLKRQADEMALTNDITINEIKKNEERERKEKRTQEIASHNEFSKNFYCKTYGRGCDN